MDSGCAPPDTIKPTADHQPRPLANSPAESLRGEVQIAAALPIAVLPLWRIPRARWVLLAVCWAVAVGCCTHAFINSLQRVLSLAGLLRIEYSPTVWASIDRRAADLQDLFFNEPWFLVEGLGFGALGWIVLGSGRRRRWWVGTAMTAISVLTVIGMLAATGVIGKTIIG
jgi:hypothetical protein